MLRIIASVINGITKCADYCSQICLAALMLMVFREVIWRYIFDRPSIFSVEISEYILVFITFMSAAWILRSDRHVNMTAVTMRLPKKMQVYLDIVTSLMVMVFCVVLIWKGFRTVVMAYTGDYHSASLVNFPLWIAYSFIPVGSSVLVLQYLVRIGERIKMLRQWEKGEL